MTATTLTPGTPEFDRELNHQLWQWVHSEDFTPPLREMGYPRHEGAEFHGPHPFWPPNWTGAVRDQFANSQRGRHSRLNARRVTQKMLAEINERGHFNG